MNQKVILCAALLICSGAANSGLLGPSSFEDCVLDKMKGQQPTMRPTAARACEREFERPVDVGLVHFAWTAPGTVSIDKNDSDFAITRAVFSFSRVACESAKDSDYSIRAEVRFAGWIPSSAPKTSGAFTFAEEVDPSALRCMRTEEVYGKRVR